MSEFPSFEAYVQSEGGGWAGPGKCGACLREAPRLTPGVMRGGHRFGDRDCEWCVRYHYGYDQAEAKVAHTLMYGAVREALRQEIPSKLLTEAVDEAILDDCEEETKAWAAAMARNGLAS